jgi:hypothetical protein
MAGEWSALDFIPWMRTKKALTSRISSSSALSQSLSSASSLCCLISSDVANICGKTGLRMTLTDEREIAYIE